MLESGADCASPPAHWVLGTLVRPIVSASHDFCLVGAAAGGLFGDDLLWSDIHPDVIGPSDNLDHNRPGLGVSAAPNQPTSSR